jgi:hypothetical protein
VALGFIRYFAVTNDGPIGRAALAYLPSLLRIAPVRVISKSGQLEGAWRRYEALIMTPMTGSCVSCVCTHPSSWVWEQSIPMPSANVGVQSAATAESTPQTGGIARGVVELYTPKVRNVLFVVEPPTTHAQHKTAARYEAVLFANADSVRGSDFVPAAEPVGDLAPYAYVDFVYQTLDHSKIDHAVIRTAVLGPPPPTETPYR